MKYLATYCVHTREAGANPLYHSCILLSKTDEAEQQLEVVENWGFYGVPTTGDRTTYANQLKLKLGMDVDLKGNHGMLRKEDPRSLDLGTGLRGVSFELTEEQFKQLQSNCHKMVEDQEQAVKEVVEPQGIKGKPPEKTRIYSHEQYSTLIFQLEKIKAAQKGQPPRLKPFELCLTFGLTGPSLQTSTTCKSQAVALLATVLTEKQIARLTENGNHPTVPRFSGPMEELFIYSTGPLRQHKKSDGSIVHYRDRNDKDVRLFLSLPPQELEALTEDTIDRFEINDEYCSDVKAAVKKLQRLEWLIRNAVVPDDLTKYKELLLNQIIDSYKSFFSIAPKNKNERVSGWAGFALTLFSLPRDREEQALLDKLNKAKMLFNSLYMACVDNWKIDLNSPLEMDSSATKDEDDSVVFCNSIESITSYLTTTDKKNMCKILGRSYVEDNSSLNEERNIPETINTVSP